VQIGDAFVKVAQHDIIAAKTKALKEELLSDSRWDLGAQAALRSAGGPGAAGWLRLPREPAHHLSNKQWDIAVRTRLDMVIPECCGVCQHRRPTGAICGAPLDSKGLHARTCAIGGWVVRKHDACCGILKDWCLDLGCHVESEVVLP